MEKQVYRLNERLGRDEFLSRVGLDGDLVKSIARDDYFETVINHDLKYLESLYVVEFNN